MAGNDDYPQRPKGNFHFIGVAILIAFIAFIVAELWQNPPREGAAAVPTQAGTAR